MFTKKALGYINYRVINLNKNTGKLVQKRFSDFNTLKKTIEGISNRQTKKAILGKKYNKKHILIEVEDICVAVEYGKYLSYLYDDEKITVRYGKKVDTVLKEGKVFNSIQNGQLELDYIEGKEPLSLDRISTKNKYDNIYAPKNVEEKSKHKGGVPLEQRLEKVEQLAREKGISFRKEDYVSIYNEMEWKCNKCKGTFTATFKRLKDRKHACKKCGESKYLNGAIAVRNLVAFADSHGLSFKKSSYNKELGELTRMMFTCKHGERELVSIKAIKRRLRNNGERCPLCKCTKKEV